MCENFGRSESHGVHQQVVLIDVRFRIRSGNSGSPTLAVSLRTWQIDTPLVNLVVYVLICLCGHHVPFCLCKTAADALFFPVNLRLQWILQGHMNPPGLLLATFAPQSGKEQTLGAYLQQAASWPLR